MKKFTFTMDDNILFFKNIAENKPKSIFENPYLAMLFRLHQRFDLKVQLNLFYQTEGFDLSQMPDTYKNEWAENSDWLKLSFHSKDDSENPYISSGYDEVFADCDAVNREILRFAGEKTLAKTTTIHYAKATKEGISAVADNGVKGLLGLFTAGVETSYEIEGELVQRLEAGELLAIDGMSYAAVDLIINLVTAEEIVPRLQKLFSRDTVRVMIHEQYFYEDYKHYQPDFEEKLATTFSALREQGFESAFFEEII